jgi:hypothetical protein
MNLGCEIVVNSEVEHLRQIYAGYALLHQQKVLNLKQIIPREALRSKTKPNRWTDYRFFNAKVIFNKKTVILYDLHDRNLIDEGILREADFYFKRSYDADYVSQLAEREKVFPLGLNYPVSVSQIDLFRLQRAALYRGKEKFKAIMKSLRIDNLLQRERAEAEQLKNLEACPDFMLEPQILFMARTWNPNKIENKAQKEAVQAMNENRAEYVRRLRGEFGDKFFGGLARDDYSQQHFKDCLLPNENLSTKRNYLKTLKRFPICVATVGLNGSNGWKLGEYVALSKAILSERLRYIIAGDFANGKNYLEFNSPEELIEAATRLFENKELRREMMRANYDYYLNYLRPDKLILNTLRVARLISL